MEFFNMPMEKLADGEEVPVAKLSKPSQFKFNPSKRTIGIEVECTNHIDGGLIGKTVADIGGAIVHDGSVQFEINTPPMNGDVFVHGMAYLSEQLIKAGAKASAQAGTHMHIGCRDMTYQDMRHLCMLYGRLESALYSIIDPRRLSNTYCRPCGGRSLVAALANPMTAKADLIRMVYNREPGRDMESLWRSKSGSRYWGLNLHSWFYRGTVEFRLHHGTVQWEKIVGFGMLLLQIADGALRYSEKDIVEWPQGKEGLLKLAVSDWHKKWIEERWSKFAAKRKNKDEPIVDL